MNLKSRILVWYLAKRIKKGALKMKPWPKSIGVLGAVGALATAIFNGVKTGDWSGLVPALGAVIAVFSHSATGTGGQPTP